MLLQDIIDTKSQVKFSDLAYNLPLRRQLQDIFLLDITPYNDKLQNVLVHFKIINKLTGGNVIGPTTAAKLLTLLKPTADYVLADPAALICQPITESYEGCHLVAYVDPSSGNLPITWGWGSTLDIQGKPFKLGFTGSQSLADHLMLRDLQNTVKSLRDTVPYWSILTLGQRACLIDFSYNTGYFFGAKNFDSLNAALSKPTNYSKVPIALIKYNNPGSKAQVGLDRRRRAEIELWNQI
jgi:lysozyme